MSQASTPTSPQPVIDYNARPSPRRSSWLTPRVLLFVLVFGMILGAPIYILIDHGINHGIKQGKDGYLDVDLKTISLFPLDQQAGTTEDVPQRFRDLDGKKVMLVGEMWAGSSAGPMVGSFDLCYSVAKCCFSGPPQAQHFIKSTMAEQGKGIPMYDGLVRVKGTLSVSVVREADKVQSVYRMKIDSLEPI